MNITEDHNWMENTGFDLNSLSGAIEAFIFISERPLKIQKIRDYLDRDKKIPLNIINQALINLQREYEKSHHGIRLAEVGGGYQFRTKGTYAKYVKDFVKPSSFILSSIALEVLAIIAYKQPISRFEIDKIRGVDSSHILRNLIDKNLVKVCGKSNDMGKLVTYGTTHEFLEIFNLSSLEDLPPEHELEALAEDQDVGEISDIREFIHSAQELINQDGLQDLSELDELSEKIKKISPHTTLTASIKKEEQKVSDSTENSERKSSFDLLEEAMSQQGKVGLKPSSDDLKELDESLDLALAKLASDNDGQGDVTEDSQCENSSPDSSQDSSLLI